MPLSNAFRLLAIGTIIATIALNATVALADDQSLQDAFQTIRLLPPGPGNPRNSEGDFVKLSDGRTLFVYTHFTGGGSDHSEAYLAGRFSSDGGETWSEEDTLILPNEGDLNIMSVSLLRLQDDRIAMFYMRKNSLADCRPMMRVSTDEAQTWSEPVECIPDEKADYYILNNDRVIQLENGRLLMPVAQHEYFPNEPSDWDGVIHCYSSDDAGATWQASETALRTTAEDGTRILTQEPGVVELKDGRIMMFARTDVGSQYVSYSSDDGNTWSDLQPSSIFSPRSPATIERIPGTDTLLMAWNDHENIDPSLSDYRTPYTVAVSYDEGLTWKKNKTLYDDPYGWYCYTGMYFEDDYVLLGHCAGDRRTGGLNETHITRISLDWLTALIPGDANGDGRVDGSDVTILAGNWQAGVGDSDPLTITWEMGDFNGDGQIDGSDVTILAGNWQSGVTATAAVSVPEPNRLTLLTLLAIGGLVLRRKAVSRIKNTV